MINKYPLFISLILILFTGPAYSLTTIPLIDNKDHYPIGLYSMYYEDQDGSLSIKDITSEITSNRFQQSTDKILNFGYTRSYYWLKYRLRNNSTRNKWYLEIPYSLIDDIQFYIEKNDKSGYTVKKGGRNYSFSQKEIKNRRFTLSFKLEKGQEKTFYLRLGSKDSLPVPLEVVTPEGLMENDHIDQLLIGIYYGLIFVLILYNLLIFFTTKDLNYLYYLLTLVTLHFMFHMGINGLTFEYIGNNSLFWSRTSIAVFISTGIFFADLFTVKFLNTRTTLPHFHKVLLFSMAWAAIETILAFIIDYHYAIQSAVLMAMFSGSVLFITGIFSLIKGNRAARFYILSWPPLILGGLTYGIKVWGFVPSNLFTEYSYQFGSAVQSILLAIALGDNMNILKKERFLVQQELLDKEKHSRENQEKFNIELEKLVKQRTLELNNTLAELQEKDRIMQDELKLAADIQQGIIPPTPVSYNGINVVGYYSSMEKIGGDFYDIFPMKGGYLCILIADVSGHGIPAAFVTAMAKITFHDAAQNFKFPRDIFRHVNDQLLRSINTADYLTAFMVIISPSYEVFYANASHPKGLLMRKYNGEFEEWDTEGLFVGALRESNELYEEKTDFLDFGDRLILYTDGLTEARNNDGIEFGVEKLKQVLAETAELDIEEAKSSIIRSWFDYTDGAPIRDDLSFLLIEIDSIYKTLLEFKNKGLEHMYHNNFADAITEFNKALEIDTSNKDIHNLLGKCYHREKKYSDAIDHLTQYVKINNEDADAWNILAASHFNKKNYEESLSASKKACQFRPNFKTALEIKGMSLTRLNEIDDAVEVWEHLLKIDPHNSAAMSELQQIREKMK